MSNAEELCRLARQSVGQRDFKQAQQFYFQALGLKPEDPHIHDGLGTVCFLLGDLHSASHHFSQVTRLDPKRASAFINLGAVYNRLKLYDEALQALRRGIQLDNRRGEGYYNMGLVYRQKSQLDLAIQAYREAIRLSPRMADAHYNLANLYVEVKRYGEAIPHYKTALDLRPAWEEASLGLAEAQALLEAAKNPEPLTPVVVKSAQSPGGNGGDTLDRLVDPSRDATLLNALHTLSKDCDTHGRIVHKILEKEVQPAVKELSACLLLTDSSLVDIDKCINDFDQAMKNLLTAQQSLKTIFGRIDTVGHELLHS